MQDNNYGKEYDAYFSEIERRLSKEKRTETQSESRTQNRTAQKSKTKRKTVKVKAYLYRASALLIPVLLIILIVFSVKACAGGKTAETEKSEDKSTAQKTEKTVNGEKDKKPKNIFAKFNGNQDVISSDIQSKSVIFIDDKQNTVVAQRNAKERMFPASTTKIMTLIVAVENIKDYSDTFTMTYQITDPLYKNGATVAGFLAGEKINMYDLIYGTILPSGGDAAIALAQKISGSEEQFVLLMNKKAKEIGLENTNFTNCTGLFDKNHYTTAYDLSVLIRYAMQNETCKKVLETYKYTTSKTDKHPNGLELENTIFKYMYGTEPEGATITGGKTGFVNESGYCIASFGESDSGKLYVCVTLGGPSRWPAVYDQINLYSKYAK